MVLPSGAKILEGVRRISGRDIIRVQLPGGTFIQPFYRSSGQSSGMSGAWLPFDGLLALSGAEGDHWFHKSRFTSGAANDASNPLHRYGTQLLKDISRELGQIPELALVSGQQGKASDINTWLGTVNAANFNRSSQGLPAITGVPHGAPVGYTPPPATPPTPSSPSGGSGPGNGSPPTPPVFTPDPLKSKSPRVWYEQLRRQGYTHKQALAAISGTPIAAEPEPEPVPQQDPEPEPKPTPKPYQRDKRIDRRQQPVASDAGDGGNPPAPPPSPPAAPDNAPQGKPPVIHTVRPLKGRVGAHIRLAGIRLDQISEVSIGGVTAPIYSIDRALIIVVVPDSATYGSAKIEARYAGGSVTAPGTFTVVAPEEESDGGAGTSEPSDSSDAGSDSNKRTPKGFWESLLTDSDIRGAVQRAAPSSMRGFVNPLMDKGAELLNGSEAALSGQMGQMLGLAGGAAGGFVAGRAAGTSGILSGIGGLVGGALAGPIGAAVGAAIGTLLEKAAQKVVENIHEIRALGEQSVDNITKGAISLTGKAMDVGLQIGDTLLRGALRPFGASGTALAGFANTLGHSFQGVLTTGLNLASGGVRTAGGLLAGGAGFLMTYVGAAAGMMMGGPIFSLIGALVASGVGKALMGVVNSVTGVLGNVFGAMGNALGEIGRVGGAALNTIITIMDDVRSTAMNLSKSILDLSQQSGLGVGASAAAVNNLMGFGISPQQTAQMFGQNVLYTQAQDRGWGIKGAPGSEENLRSFRAQYQRMLEAGGGNPLIANAMAQSTGKSALIPMANLGDAAFNRSLNNGFGLQMSEAAVREWQQNFGLLQNDASRFVEYIKFSFGNAFLPAMQRGLGVAVEFFRHNKDEIIDGAKAIGRWFYASLPAMVLDGAILIVTGFNTVTSGLSNIIRSLYDSKGAVHQWVEGFLGGIDKMVYGFRTIIAWATGAARAMSPAVMPWQKAQAARDGYLDSMQQTFPWQTQLQNQFNRATRPQYNAQGQLIPNAGDRAISALNAANQRGTAILRTLQGARARFDPQQQGADYDRMFDTLQRIEQNTGRTPNIHADIDVRISPVEDFYAKVMSYETWNTWQTLGASNA